MHIPAGPDSTVSLFERIDTVFGDPQSIEQDLSTFSGHLKLLGEVLETCSDRSLLLMDEIVVGTEPTGGSALAIAVLEALADRGARGLVTTHYDRLKTMALADPRFQNASVGIDVRTMTPTYRLAIGTPGSSSPIEMAKKLGMNPGVLARATELVGSQTQELQSALAALDRERSELEHARDEARAEKERLRAAQKELEAERARMRQKGLEIARELQKEVLGELAKARDVARDAIAALQREKQPVRIEEQRRRVERAATQVRSAVATAEGAKEAAAPSATPLEPGDFERLAEGTGVFVLSLGRRGTLVRKPENRRKIEVLVGRARMTTEVDNLAWPPESPEAKKPLRPTLTPAEAAKVAPPVAVGDDAPPRVPSYTVDLRGMRVDEALDEVVRRFDAAMMEGKNALYLIHGHGSGVLKTAIRELCEKTRYVRRWRQGERDEGGDGVTVAFLEG
jgi:DNA mismatch repair protein MutS2